MTTSPALKVEAQDTVNLLMMEYLRNLPDDLFEVEVQPDHGCALQIHDADSRSGLCGVAILVPKCNGDPGSEPRLKGFTEIFLDVENRPSDLDPAASPLGGAAYR